MTGTVNAGTAGRSAALLFASLALGFVVTRVYASLLAVLAGPISAELDLSPAELGSVASAFPLVLAVVQPVNGVLLDRYGPARIVPPLLMLAIAGTAVFAFAQSQAMLFAGYAIIGLGVSATLMGSLLALSMHAPPQRLATLAGALMAVGGIGQLLTATPLAWLTELAGWRGAVLLITTLVIAAAAAIAIAVPHAAVEDRPRESWLRSFSGYLEVLREPGFIAVFALSCTSFPMLFAIRALWAGPYMTSVFDLDDVAVGNVLLAMSVGMIVGTAGFGPLDRLVGSRKRVCLAGAVVSVVVLLAMAMFTGHSVHLAVALLVLLGIVGTYDAVLLTHGRAMFPPRLAGRGLTALNVGTFIGVGILQAATGFLVDGLTALPGVTAADAYSVLFCLFAGFVGLGTIGYAFARDVPPGTVR